MLTSPSKAGFEKRSFQRPVAMTHSYLCSKNVFDVRPRAFEDKPLPKQPHSSSTVIVEVRWKRQSLGDTQNKWPSRIGALAGRSEVRETALTAHFDNPRYENLLNPGLHRKNKNLQPATLPSSRGSEQPNSRRQGESLLSI